MGVLTDYFAATTKELAKASTTGVPEGAPRVDAKGFGVLPFTKLAKRLEVDGDGTEPGEPVLHADGYEWFVQRVTPAMAAALGAMTDAAIAKHAKALVGKDDFDWPEPEARALLGRLRDLAVGAKKTKRALYMWSSP